MTTPDFLSAALRHVRDAEAMLDEGPAQSLDQSWHLAGFAIECARKAGIQERWFDIVLGHSFSNMAETIVDVAIALDPAASRLPLRGWPEKYNRRIQHWLPEHRYERTGSRPADQVNSLVNDARHACTEISVALTLDGLLKTKALV